MELEREKNPFSRAMIKCLFNPHSSFVNNSSLTVSIQLQLYLYEIHVDTSPAAKRAELDP